VNERPSGTQVDRVGIPSSEERIEDKITAALLGGAIADAMGWITEFIKSPVQLESRFKVSRISDFVSWEKKSGGRFNPYIDYIGAGEYSDDTQLTLCVARSIQSDGSVDNEYFAKQEMTHWLAYARGAGATITAAAKALSRKSAHWNKNFFTFRRGTRSFDYRASGANGAAMRVGPIAMANPFDQEFMERQVWRNAIVTHGHPRAILGSLVYARALAYIIATPDPKIEAFIDGLKQVALAAKVPKDDSDLKTWVTEWNRGCSESFERLLSQVKQEMVATLNLVKPNNNLRLFQVYKELGCFEPATKGSGIATVGAALATFLRHRKSFDGAILEAVNMIGCDTDTIAAMVGSLAGAHAGYSAIPERWAEKMQDFTYFMRVAATLTRVAERRAHGPELQRTSSYIAKPNLPPVSALPEASDLAPGKRSEHPIFGRGTVRNIHVQPLKGKRGGDLLFIVVEFDSGQSCNFKFFRPRTARKSQLSEGSLFR